MKALVLGAFLLAVGAVPASASSVTIDSTNCTNNCYGLSWMLTINPGSYSFGGTSYSYEALLSVADDPAISGTPSVVISAANFKVSSTVSGAALYTVPASTVLGAWATSLNGLNSAGCSGSGSGFICSQSATNPASFTASSVYQTWGWYFNSSDPIFAGLNGAHIGAKVTNLSSPGKLMSETATAQVPEPASLSLIGAGAFGLATVLARRRRAARR